MADIRITGRMVNAIRITLDTNDHDAIRQQLSKTLQNASTAGALVVLESSVEQELILDSIIAGSGCTANGSTRRNFG